VTDGDCSGNQICSAGACALECALNSDCALGQNCVANRCQAECVYDSDCGTGETCESGRCQLTQLNPYSGTFMLSSSSPIQRCNANVLMQYESRLVQATQDLTAYTFVFTESTYYGTISSQGVFTVSWSGSQGFANSTCGNVNSANVFSASFSNPNLFSGTIKTELFFDYGACNCTLYYPITGTRQ